MAFPPFEIEIDVCVICISCSFKVKQTAILNKALIKVEAHVLEKIC